MAAVHYIGRRAAIWIPPKSVKRPFIVTCTLCSEMPALMQRVCGIRTRVFGTDLFARRVSLPCTTCCQPCLKALHLVSNLWRTLLCLITACVFIKANINAIGGISWPLASPADESKRTKRVQGWLC